MMTPLPDSAQREAALDVSRSFIVQAPAGSGKTELLTRRFVNLLSCVKVPEEIIAITFTRKAAAEMRHRVLSLLPDCAPHRLRIMTIDAFCAFLCGQMPLKSKLNAYAAIADNPDSLYQQAIQNLLLDAPESVLADFLYYLNNDIARVNDLLIDILKNRDQWLSYIFSLDAVDALEKSLKNLIEEMQAKTLLLAPAFSHLDSEKIAESFLTKQGELRKKLPVGFSAVSPELMCHLRDLQQLPPGYYSAVQKKFIVALSKLLPLLIAELQLIFKEAGQYDFIEVALSADQALGDEIAPTDLNLRLDYQIQHLLIDEFQDTSIAQWKLLQKITAGWTPQDGRTLFLVGDPMQSIYQFRKAEVGLFLEVQKHGIHDIKLHSLTLSANFRSNMAMVNWYNAHFSAIFPPVSDASVGAIAYTPAQGIKQAAVTKAVSWGETDNIATIIKQYPEKSIAILVRSRSHLKTVMPILEAHHIAFRAVEIENLGDHPVVQDLFALTRALLHPADRIAWFAILRAPWCGLSLAVLQALAENSHKKTLWDNLLSYPDKELRIQHFILAIQWAMDNRGRFSLREWIEKTWLKLNGHYCLASAQHLKIAEAYFNLLDKVQEITLIEKQLSQLFLPAYAYPDIRVDIMTIHKAKGLEFDIVILPSLEKVPRASTSALLLWMDRLNVQGNIDLLVAPIREAAEKTSQLYNYLKYEENKREAYELQRLLYVACTRAKESLYLLYSNNFKIPAKKSFLAQLWPLMLEADKVSMPAQIQEKKYCPPIFKRLPISALNAFADDRIVREKTHCHSASPVMLAQLQQRHVGTVVHAILHYLSENPDALLSEDYLKMQLLQHAGTTTGFEIIQTCLANIQQDPRAQWILKPHRDAKSEYALMANIDRQITAVIIDRTFIDEQDRRWIIDYKITTEVSLDNYRAQLEKYARIFKLTEKRSIYLGLYFPLTQAWIEWAFAV